MNTSSDLWAVIPAGGIGQRFGARVPKQYVSVAGRSVLQWTVDALSRVDEITTIVVAVEDERAFRNAVRDQANVIPVAGGASRAESVQNALQFIAARADNPWVLVHDAARPCVKADNIRRLIAAVLASEQGGLLAEPVTDTVKKVANARATETLPREQIWLAHTPQMFRCRDLYDAQRRALAAGIAITDEASAMSFIGEAPLVVRDTRDNIKITQPEDLELASWYLQKAMEPAGEPRL